MLMLKYKIALKFLYKLRINYAKKLLLKIKKNFATFNIGRENCLVFLRRFFFNIKKLIL